MNSVDQYAAQAERLAAQAHHFTYGDGADPGTGHALAAEGQIYATLALAAAQPAPSTAEVFRAEHPDSGITLGHYTSAAAARAHCEALTRLRVRRGGRRVNARAITSAAGVILAALQQHRTSAGIACALDAAGLLNSPERAADLTALRKQLVELETRATAARGIHTKFPDSEHCTHDGEPWPCPTLAALGHD
ncbi:hypothetical protein [Streptomyces sp. NPDC088785]|uniref:hypothetical protein n=1 Tax=Streptomyces sp. NPDC088785 TaxID=3365897 RepID=UPI003817FDF0